tara:strand:+ start:1373 stop:2554 length:1182 start_codon:yes stop_codon:yes gene_type:complete
MLFQTFDNKEKCPMVYKAPLFQDNVTLECTQTWSYASYLKNENIQYAQLFVNGASLEEVCPPEHLEKYYRTLASIEAIVRSAIITKINLDETCIYSLLPEHVLLAWAETKNEVCKFIFENYQKPKNYDHLLKITKMITEFGRQPLDLNLEIMDRITVQDKNTYKQIKDAKAHITYEQFKTRTGRLSTKKHSFPIMTLAKKYRKVLAPTNHWLFELDFNACELRTALALLSQPQPEEDLHEWNLQNVFKGVKDRETAKKSIFAWLYNPNSNDEKVSHIYDRGKLKTLYFMGDKVVTPFDREIPCDEEHAVNYVVQSTAADLLFEQMYKVWEFLESRKSFIKFCNHDSIVIDLHEDDQYEVNNIKQLFSHTRFGEYKVNCTGGKNWSEMRKLNIK